MTQIPGFGTPEVHNSNAPFNFVLVDPRPSGDDWPWWQGTDHRNVANTKNFPTHWSSSDHEGWHVPLPGYGNASPCLWGNQLFLPVHDTDHQRLALVCLQRDTGRIAWRTMLHQGSFSRLAEKASNAWSSPACDGQNVFTASNDQGKLWITAVEMTGRVAWQREVGPYYSNEAYQINPTAVSSQPSIAKRARSSGESNDPTVKALVRRSSPRFRSGPNWLSVEQGALQVMTRQTERSSGSVRHLRHEWLTRLPSIKSMCS